MPLTALAAGFSARVCGINASADMNRRFRDIGLIDGTRIKCVLNGGGGMSAYLIRGALIAIRKRDAENIAVSPLTEKTIDNQVKR